LALPGPLGRCLSPANILLERSSLYNMRLFDIIPLSFALSPVLRYRGITGLSIEYIGVPRAVLSRYDTPRQRDEALGLTPQGIRRRIEEFLA
jgi:hypothetical protein